MMSILTLALMVLLVATMRHDGDHPGSRARRSNARSSKPQGQRGDTIIAGPGVILGPPQYDPNNPNVVTYSLMKNKKLPSPTARALRRLGRPFGWMFRRMGFSKKRTSPVKRPRPESAESVELQNFLEARNREIIRRKSEDPSKRGPEDTLH